MSESNMEARPADLIRESITQDVGSGHWAEKFAADFWTRGLDERNERNERRVSRDLPEMPSTMTVPLAVLASALPATQVGLLTFAAHDHQRQFAPSVQRNSQRSA